MADNGNQGGKGMWPSLETASRVADISNVFFVGSLVVGVVSTVLIIWMGGVKEWYWDQDRRASSERIEQLKAANLALEAKIQPRRLSGDDSAKLTAALSKLQPLPIGVVSRLLDTEGADFADDIAGAFSNAQWQSVRQRDWTMPDKGVAVATLEGTPLPDVLRTALLAALEAGKIKATVTIIPQTQKNTTSAHFQPHGLYLLVGAKPQ